MSSKPQITILYLLYNAEGSVARLVRHLRQQTFPEPHSVQVWFVDDGSTDRTLPELESALRAEFEGSIPDWIQIRPNPRNLGLAGSLNHSLRQMDSPYVLTCHVDCFFESADYVAGMSRVLDRHERMAAITGKPMLDREVPLTFAQKLNTIVNLMDVLPAPTDSPELVEIGFAEGRCDAFRIQALAEVGFYPEGLRTSGEDQHLARSLRKAGYSIGQALHLRFTLSTSTAQDTFSRLVRHLFLFGRTQVYLAWAQYRTPGSLQKASAGKNRQQRLRLRLVQLSSAAALLATFGSAITGLGGVSLVPGCVVVICLFVKYRLWLGQYRLTRPSFSESVLIFFGQFALELSYFAGFVFGAARVATGIVTGRQNH